MEELKTVVASVYSGDTVNITGDITLDSDLTMAYNLQRIAQLA